MQKVFGLVSLINSPYKESIYTLAVMLYDFSEAEFFSTIISKDTDKPKPTTMDEIQKVYIKDDIIQRIIQAKLKDFRKIFFDIAKNHFKLELGDYQVLDNLFYVKTRLYVPTNEDNMVYTSIIKEVHIFLPGGYAGRSSIYNRLSQWYYWPRMINIVARFIRSRDICKRSKSYREQKQGLLKLSPIPDQY